MSAGRTWTGDVRRWRMLPMLAAGAILAACGGGGGGPGGATNGVPVADAGADQTAMIGVPVSLDGRASSDPDGDPLSYRWTLEVPAGSAATLTGAVTATAGFVPDVGGTYVATLIVADGRSESPPDATSIAVAVTGVTVSGRVTFDRVGHDPTTSGLDYARSWRAPVRGAVLEVVSRDGVTLASTVTDDDGGYAVTAPAATPLRVRVHARMLRTGGPGWDVRVVDNTQSEALYTLGSSIFDSGAGDSTLDLHAPSGWSEAESRYATVRAAAPFAILDTIRTALGVILQTDPGLVLPPLKLNWSPSNRTSGSFDPARGEILTTAYFFDPDLPEAYQEIFVLGDADVDTDEYDAHVVAHEWAHYLEDRLARTDSTGGSHSIVSTVDPRLAFSEGWANAFSAIALGEPVYRDALGAAQARGFSFDIEDNTTVNPGWYNESSIHSVLYDIYDDAPDGIDATALGLAPILQGLRTWHRETDAVTTVFSLLPDLKAAYPADAPNIDALLDAQSIVGADMDIFASGETNDAGSGDVLPLYTRLVTNAGPVEVCSIVAFGTYNGLSVRRFIVFDPPRPGDYRIHAAGPAGSDPDMVLFRRGAWELFDASGPVESRRRSLVPGRHVLEIYEFSNVSNARPALGRTCFQVSVESL